MSELRPEVQEALDALSSCACSEEVMSHGNTQKYYQTIESELHCLTAELEKVKAEMDSAEWLCEKCNTVYPRSSLRTGFQCVECPNDNCRGPIRPKETALRRRAEAERDKLREVLLSVKRDFDVCDWSCVNCGTDQRMKSTDIYHDVCKALGEAQPHD